MHIKTHRCVSGLFLEGFAVYSITRFAQKVQECEVHLGLNVAICYSVNVTSKLNDGANLFGTLPLLKHAST